MARTEYRIWYVATELILMNSASPGLSVGRIRGKAAKRGGIGSLRSASREFVLTSLDDKQFLGLISPEALHVGLRICGRFCSHTVQAPLISGVASEAALLI